MNTLMVGRQLATLRVTRGPGGRLSVLSTDVDMNRTNTVYTLPGDAAERVAFLAQLRTDVADALEQAQAELVDDNLKSLTAPLPSGPARFVASGYRPELAASATDEGRGQQLDNFRKGGLADSLVGPQPDPDDLAGRRRREGEGIARDLERENAFFTRTQGWDPRGDGPSLDDEPDVGRPAIGGSDD